MAGLRKRVALAAEVVTVRVRVVVAPIAHVVVRAAATAPQPSGSAAPRANHHVVVLQYMHVYSLYIQMRGRPAVYIQYTV